MVERFLDEVLNGRPDDALASQLVSSAELRHRVASFHAAFPDLEVETNVLLVDGDLVAGHFTGRGTHLGLFQGVPPTGAAWTAGCTAIYRVDGDRIAETWLNWDLLSLLEQLGALERAQTVSA